MRTCQEPLSLDFSDNRVPFALEPLIAKVLKLLPRLRSLNVEVSIYEMRPRVDISKRRPLSAALFRDFHQVSIFSPLLFFFPTCDDAQLSFYAMVGSTNTVFGGLSRVSAGA